MLNAENSGKKVLVTMIGANNAIDTEYAFFESYKGDTDENVYRRNYDNVDSCEKVKYGYPFWAKIRSVTKEKAFDQIVFIGTWASKWESLISNAERLSKPQDNAEDKKPGKIADIETKLEQINQYVNQFIGTGYDLVTDENLAEIERYMRNLLTPEIKKKERENENQRKHIAYMEEHLSGEHLHEYEAQLGNYITLAVNVDRDETEKLPIEVKVILIKEGRTESENLENIIKIQEELLSIPISEITLDVTNGLRSHPMYVWSIINNISAIENKGIPINIYYGMFDAKLKAQGGTIGNNYVVPLNPREGEVAPMVDLKEIQMMDRWTRAISEFFSNGSVIQIIELLNDVKRIINNENSESIHVINQKNEWIDNYIKAFESFSLAVNSNNLVVFENAMKKIDSIKTYMIQDRDNNQKVKLPKYIQICLDYIVLNIWSQFKVDDAEEYIKYSSYMFALANWYLQQNRLGDSVRTFQEAVVTYVMEKYPNKISRLLEKRMIQWSFNKSRIFDVMFDAKVRKVIRDAIFEDSFEIQGKEREYSAWDEWTKEYHYMKNQIHNPDALLYNLNPYRANTYAEISTRDINGTQAAKKNIESFSKKISECLNKTNGYNMFEKRIDYLLSIQYNDVFISYRRSYHSDDEGPLNDGVLLVTALSDYFSHKGMKVFVDKNKMRGVQGEFSPFLQQNLRNSKLCLVVLGKDAYARDYTEKDEYYKEIITAVKNSMKIAVICMEDFYRGGNDIRFGQKVEDQEELMKVVNGLQRVGSEFSDRWKYENILSLRKCAYEEIIKMLEEE